MDINNSVAFCPPVCEHSNAGGNSVRTMAYRIAMPSVPTNIQSLHRGRVLKKGGAKYVGAKRLENFWCLAHFWSLERARSYVVTYNNIV